MSRRNVVLVAGALALVLATIGTVAALADKSSPATQVPALSVASPSNVGAAAAATQQPPSQVAPNPIISVPASPVLADGSYPAYIDRVYVEQAKITIDIVQVFENDAAVKAALERFRPGPALGDSLSQFEAESWYIYIRNENPRLRTLPVASEVDFQFADGCEASGEQHAALTELAERVRAYGDLYYYDVTVANGQINQITQYLAEAAC